MFRKRKFKTMFYVIALLVLAISIGLNLYSLGMFSVPCLFTQTFCAQAHSVLGYTYLAYGSIALFCFMGFDWLLFHSSEIVINENKVQNETENKGNFTIDFEKESSREYVNPYVQGEKE